MTATNDTPLKRFTAFWVVLGLFALFGVLTLIVGMTANTPEDTPADQAGAKRRLAVRAEVEAAQAANLTLKEGEGSVQAPPALIFESFGAKLAATKPQAVQEERHRDPASAKAEEAAPEEEAPADSEDSSEVPANSDSPA